MKEEAKETEVQHLLDEARAGLAEYPPDVAELVVACLRAGSFIAALRRTIATECTGMHSGLAAKVSVDMKAVEAHCDRALARFPRKS